MILTTEEKKYLSEYLRLSIRDLKSIPNDRIANGVVTTIEGIRSKIDLDIRMNQDDVELCPNMQKTITDNYWKLIE